VDSIKDFLTKNLLKWRYSKETTPEFARIGFKLGLGIMFVIAAIFFFL